jgi:hypothetical protein
MAVVAAVVVVIVVRLVRRLGHQEQDLRQSAPFIIVRSIDRINRIDRFLTFL